MKSFLAVSICLLLTIGQSTSSGAQATDLKKPSNQLIPGTVVYGYNFGMDEASRLLKDGVFIGNDSKSNFMDLVYGNILLVPDSDLVIRTRAATIHIDAGAAAFIIQSTTTLLIFDLGQQPESKQITIVAGRYKFLMQPERVLALTTDNIQDFKKSDFNSLSLPYNRLQLLDLPDLSSNALVADFAISSAMNNIAPLKRLAISNNAEDKLLIQRLALNGSLNKNIAANTSKTLESNTSEDLVIMKKGSKVIKIN